jgi:hypothetical protein
VLTLPQPAPKRERDCDCEPRRRRKRPSSKIANVRPYSRRMSQYSLDNLRKG